MGACLHLPRAARTSHRSLGFGAVAFSLSFVFFSPSPAAIYADGPTTRPTETSAPGEEELDLLGRIERAFAELVERVGPTVVAIQAHRRPDSLGERADWAPRRRIGAGSGVLIREDGMILTSQHVIDGAVSIQVVLHDGRRFIARLIAADRRSDLAVIRIHADRLPHARLAGDGLVKRGHLVLALGNPLGLAGDGQAAVSHGMISAIGRPLPEAFGREEDRYYGDMIETTAPINPGNSGGPLVNTSGHIIGIVTAVGTREGGHEGVAFAVPVNEHTRAIIDRLLLGQVVEYGYLGVQVDALTPAQRREAGLPDGRGVLIDSTFARGPAEKAGLRAGDIVTQIGGDGVSSVEQFVRIIGAASVGHELTLTYVRGGRRRNARVTLTRRPVNDKDKLPVISIGFRGAGLGTVVPSVRSASNLPDKALLVLRVDAGSPADRAGLAPGDVIVRLGGNPLTDEAFGEATRSGTDVVLGLASGGSVLVKAE